MMLLPLMVFATLLPCLAASECFHGDVRLLTDESVQVCYQGRWLYICMDETVMWETEEANTVCTQLGFSNEGAVARNSCVPQSTDNIESRFLRFFDCIGMKSKVTECHFESRSMCMEMCDGNGGMLFAAVRCSRVNCTNGTIRLVGGATHRDGRVEVCRDGQWRAVCSGEWTEREGDLLCDKMGFASYGAEISEFHPRRVPTLNCTLASEQGADIVECELTRVCEEDLGIRCLRRELLEGVIEGVLGDSRMSAKARGDAVGVLVVLVVILLIGWSLSCVVLVKRNSNTQKQTQSKEHPQYKQPSTPHYEQPSTKSDVNNPALETSHYSSGDPSYELVDAGEGAGHTYSVPEPYRGKPDKEPSSESDKIGREDDEHYYHVLEVGVQKDIQCGRESVKEACHHGSQLPVISEQTHNQV